MAQAWVDILDGLRLPGYIDRLRAVLEDSRDQWLPYQTVDDVLARVDSGDYHVWVGGHDLSIDIWGITELRLHPNCRALTVIWCHGDNGPEFFEMWMKVLEDFAMIMDIDRIVVEGRKGWERIFKPLGYRFAAVELVKDITHGREAAEQCDADEQGRADSRAAGVNVEGNVAG